MSSRLITLALLWEAAAPKVGNVHRGADFEDLTFYDFLQSAVAVGPILAEAAERGVGDVALEAVRETQRVVGTNTNLGAVLLLAPLAAVPVDQPLDVGVAEVLARLSADDARAIYGAIRAAQPGGLGEVDELDVNDPPPDDLLQAMRAAADRDLVARQYVNDYHEVLHVALPWLRSAVRRGLALQDAIVDTQIRLMAELPDSLIARKCGIPLARQAASRAAAVRDSGVYGSEAYRAALADFDFWLRSDGHRRNPGTTADLIAAALFAMLRDGGPAPAEAARAQPPSAGR